ncbi:MAG: hypothetical protein M3R14_13980 [Acidobacteriota bacterium]|nr:hypothetical protein [Acidobacteriota bacterium]
MGTDLSAPGDYDGDGKTDVSVWRETNGTFYVLKSTDNALLVMQLGFHKRFADCYLRHTLKIVGSGSWQKAGSFVCTN